MSTLRSHPDLHKHLSVWGVWAVRYRSFHNNWILTNPFIINISCRDTGTWFLHSSKKDLPLDQHEYIKLKLQSEGCQTHCQLHFGGSPVLSINAFFFSGYISSDSCPSAFSLNRCISTIPATSCFVYAVMGGHECTIKQIPQVRRPWTKANIAKGNIPLTAEWGELGKHHIVLIRIFLPATAGTLQWNYYWKRVAQ